LRDGLRPGLAEGKGGGGEGSLPRGAAVEPRPSAGGGGAGVPQRSGGALSPLPRAARAASTSAAFFVRPSPRPRTARRQSTSTTKRGSCALPLAATTLYSGTGSPAA